MGELINFVTHTSPEFLASQEPELPFKLVYSREPIAADWHVVLSLTNQMTIPNSPSRTLFVVQEPPDIMRFDTRVLSLYGRVLTAPFPYLRRLKNLSIRSGLLPWRVGTAFGSGQPVVNKSRSDFVEGSRRTGDYVSVVTSSKVLTGEQKRRLRLIEYLSSRLPELIVFGRETKAVLDKSDALEVGKYHLALENCRQNGFWTEKLADPILMQNVTFYSGKNSWSGSFGPNRGVLEIDTDNPRKAYDIIRRTIDSDPYEELLPGIRANRDLILNRFNLHHAVVQTIRSMQSDSTTGQGEFEVPQHLSRLRRLIGPVPVGPRANGP